MQLTGSVRLWTTRVTYAQRLDDALLWVRPSHHLVLFLSVLEARAN